MLGGPGCYFEIRGLDIGSNVAGCFLSFSQCLAWSCFQYFVRNGIVFSGRASMYDYLANIEIWRGARRY